MKLSQKDKELLIRAFTFYYENQIWGKMLKEDNIKASEEDYNVKALITKLGIREMFPDEVKSRW